MAQQVEQITLALSFYRDDTLVLREGSTLHELAKRLKGKISVINAPEKSPAEFPRLIVQFSYGMLQVALNRFQFIVKPPAHVVSSYDESMNFAQQTFAKLLPDLAKGVGNSFEWSGAVVVLNYPRSAEVASNGAQAVAPVMHRLTTLAWPSEDLVSFDLNVGRRVGQFFRNYGLRGYDIRELQVQAQPGQSIRIDAEVFRTRAAIAETGVTVTVDVNSKPNKGKRDAAKDMNEVISDHRDAVSTLAADLNIEGVL